MKKKVKMDIKGFLNKKENMAIIAVAVIFCAGVAVTNVKSNNIPLHDGDVLVDSQNIAQAEANEDDITGETKDTIDESLEGTSTETAAESASNLDTQRANLELERNDLIAGYDDTIKNSTNESEQKNAIAQKEKLSTYMEQEVAIESIIKTKNLPASLVIITDNTVTVTVDEQDLKQNVVAKICNIVMEETGRTADKIIIQSAY